MGNVESTEHYCPYICLLRQLLKAGGVSISEGQLLELLQAVDKYCCWFPSIGTLVLKAWEKVGAELKKEYAKGTPLPVSIWSTWALIKSVLELLQTSDSSDESDDDSFEKPQSPEYVKPEGKGKPSAKPAPSAPKEGDEGFFSPPPSHCSPSLPPAFAGNIFSGEPMPTPHLSSIQKGILQAQREGDLEAFCTTFPMTIHESVALGVDPNNRNGVYEAVREPFPFKILKELKQAIQNYGVNSPFTVEIVQSVAESNRLIPADWLALAKTVLTPGEFRQFRTWWQDHAETLAAHNQTHNISISLEQLMGIGPWGRVQDQIRMNDQAIKQLRRCCLRAWEKIESKSQTSVSFQKVVQGPKEPYTEFIARLQEAISQQVTDAKAADVLLRLLAYDNANVDCKKVMNPFKGKASLNDYVKLCQGVGTESFKADLLAQAMARLQLPKFPSTCFNCGKPGHTRVECKFKKGNFQKGNSQKGNVPSLCPKCKKGNHWANQCHSKFHKDGTPLLGNGSQGKLPAPSNKGACPVQTPQMSSPTTPASNNNSQNRGDPKMKEQMKPRRVLQCRNGKTRPLLSFPPPSCNY